jgi:hypothetical protein
MYAKIQYLQFIYSENFKKFVTQCPKQQIYPKFKSTWNLKPKNLKIQF